MQNAKCCILRFMCKPTRPAWDEAIQLGFLTSEASGPNKLGKFDWTDVMRYAKWIYMLPILLIFSIIERALAVIDQFIAIRLPFINLFKEVL